MDPEKQYRELSSREAADRLDELIDGVAREDGPILVHSRKGNISALISIDDFETLEEILSDTEKIKDFIRDRDRNAVWGLLPAEAAIPLSEDFDHVYQFKVTLKGIRPPIWRRIQVPEDYTFWDLHVAIQDAMGWLDYHLHEFEVREPESGTNHYIGLPDEEGFPDDHEILPGWKEMLSTYFSPDNGTARYFYDFGDGWEHSVKLEKILERKAGSTYPLCLGGKRACPPEDCGGIAGYRDLLKFLSDPENRLDDEGNRRLSDGFDPDFFDPASIYFYDPRQRLRGAFAEEPDFEDDDSGIEQNDPTTDLIRVLSRKHLHSVWEKAKNDDFEGLAPEEVLISRIMLDHREEFFNQFEFADLTYDHIYDPENEVNPFVHVVIHAIVEKQLEERDPAEALAFYNAMLKKKCSPHDALHLLGAILAPMLFSIINYGNTFDLELYRSLLKKYKSCQPSQILDLLDKEPLLDDHFP